MSRIHEALKKAQMDRAAAQPLEVSPMPVYPPKMVDDEREDSLASTPDLRSNTLVATEEPSREIEASDLLTQCGASRVASSAGRECIQRSRRK